MTVFLLFFVAGLWMADGMALICSPERVVATVRQSLGASPGFLRWGGLAAVLGVLLLVGTRGIAYQPLWMVVGVSMVVKGIFLYAGSDPLRLSIVQWCLAREPVDYRIWGLGLCTLSVLLLDARNWGRDQ